MSMKLRSARNECKGSSKSIAFHLSQISDSLLFISIRANRYSNNEILVSPSWSAIKKDPDYYNPCPNY